jgi:transposase-like protein
MTETIKITYPTEPNERTAFWREHINQLQRSGQSQAAYSRRTGLNYHRLCYWIKQFRREQIKLDDAEQSGFLPIKLTMPTKSSKTPIASIVLQSGCTLNIYDIAVIQALINGR